ncbi:MAG: DapH/DapD/GlmU-related protein [Anaerolineae bacterium]|nr:DapH/DapD/GlmU-related protein [Anaerolineae bacterium]
METTYKIYPQVQMGKNVQIGDFVILGHPPRGAAPGELPTVIGDQCIIRSHTVIYAGNRLGKRVQTGHGVLIREYNDIGDDVSIGSHTVVEHHVRIGRGVRIHSNVFVPEYTVLEEECWIGPCVSITNVLHPRCPQAKECIKGATIKRGAKVGANVTLMPDITIGEMALVGAGSVVVEDVPPRAVVVGNPARVIRQIEQLECPYGLMEHPY